MSELDLRVGSAGFFADLTGNRGSATARVAPSAEQSYASAEAARAVPTYQTVAATTAKPELTKRKVADAKTGEVTDTVVASFGKEASGKQLQVGVQWLELGLCKALLRAITHSGFLAPTPVQATVIPRALKGEDVCARAVTGSGKTCAFVLPLLHHLCTTRPQRQGRSLRRYVRSLVIVPSRELGQQSLDTIRSMGGFAKAAAGDDIRSVLVCGGMNLQTQETELAAAPEIIVATPGRLLDICYNYAPPSFNDDGDDANTGKHGRETTRSTAVAAGRPNRSRGVDLQGIEVCILDECDKLLTVVLKEQVTDIISSFLPTRLATSHVENKITKDQLRDELGPNGKHKAVPYQLMLFSATMTQEVDAFATDFLRNDGFVANVDIGHVALASQLQQHFIRIDEPLASSPAAPSDKRRKSTGQKRPRRDDNDEDAGDHDEDNGDKPPRPSEAAEDAAEDGGETNVAAELTKIKTNYLVASCQHHYTKPQTLIFCRYRTTVHRLTILFNVLGLSATELNGQQSQEQRFAAIGEFKSGAKKYMFATDVASRGLDIGAGGVSTVINFDLPSNLTTYVHRVGRTARIGRPGVAVSLVREADDADIMRKILALSAKGNKDSSTVDELDDAGIVHQIAKVRRRQIDGAHVKLAEEAVCKAFGQVKMTLAAETLEQQMEQAEKKLLRQERQGVRKDVGAALVAASGLKSKRRKTVLQLEEGLSTGSVAAAANPLDGVLTQNARRTWTLSPKERREREAIAKENYKTGVDEAMVAVQQEMAEYDAQQSRFLNQQKSQRKREREKKAQAADRVKQQRKEDRRKESGRLEAGKIKKMKQAKVRKARKEKRAEERSAKGGKPFKKKGGKASMKKARHAGRKKRH